MHMPEGRGIGDIAASEDDPVVKPPPDKKKMGKPKTKRFKSRGEFTRSTIARDDAVASAGASSAGAGAGAGALMVSPFSTRSGLRRL